jgi:chromosome partitioning protein
MQRVALISQKGGVGKSTLTVHLAVAAWQAGQKVAVLDADPQASAGAWHRVREAADPPVAAVPVSELERALKGR